VQDIFNAICFKNKRVLDGLRGGGERGMEMWRGQTTDTHAFHSAGCTCVADIWKSALEHWKNIQKFDWNLLNF